MYCERCKRTFEESRCPACGKAGTRAPETDDPCFLTERRAPWDGMLADVLAQAAIPFTTTSALGAGLAMRVGSFFESRRFYVRYGDLARAGAIVDELFGANADEPAE